ncbi:hypothetical protein CIB48_g2572 [Xylaria polymorpha]|nr:hypothetical protein CIB48_g2572 [Xylaria polymorpha]
MYLHTYQVGALSSWSFVTPTASHHRLAGRGVARARAARSGGEYWHKTTRNSPIDVRLVITLSSLLSAFLQLNHSATQPPTTHTSNTSVPTSSRRVILFSMSHYVPSDHQADFLSGISNAGEGFGEDAFTADRPPQYNDSNRVPQTVVQDLMLSEMQDVGDHYPASCDTDSTATVLPPIAAATTATATTATPIRPHILYHVNRDYNGALEPLTEHAVAALNNDFRNGSYSGNVDEWVYGRSQCPPSDPEDLNMSVFRHPHTRTDSTLGSSWTVVSSSTPSGSQMEHVADCICAAGLQFADVPAFPMGHDHYDGDDVDDDVDDDHDDEDEDVHPITDVIIMKSMMMRVVHGHHPRRVYPLDMKSRRPPLAVRDMLDDDEDDDDVAFAAAAAAARRRASRRATTLVGVWVNFLFGGAEIVVVALFVSIGSHISDGR